MATNDQCHPPTLWAELLGELQGCLRSLRKSLRSASRCWDLSDSEAILLLCCQHSEPHGMAQQHLVQMLGASPAQVSTQIEALHRRGLVISHRAPHDRRQQVWRICPGQGEPIGQFCRSLVSHVDSLTAPVAHRDLRELAVRLRLLRQSLEAPTQVPAGAAGLPPAGDREVAA